MAEQSKCQQNKQESAMVMDYTYIADLAMWAQPSNFVTYHIDIA